MQSKSKFANQLFSGLCLIVLGGWVVWYAASFPKLEEGYPGPGLFPTVIGSTLLALGIMIAIPFFLEKEEAGEATTNTKKFHLVELILGLTSVILYPILQPIIGSLISIAIICFVIGLLLKLSPLKAALTSLGAVGFIYLTFQLLLGVSI